MNRRTFLESAGLAVAGLRAQDQPTSPAKSKITCSVMLDMLGGTIDQQIETTARAGCDSAEILTQYAAWSDSEIDRVNQLRRSFRIGFDALMGQPDWKKRPVSIVRPRSSRGVSFGHSQRHRDRAETRTFPDSRHQRSIRSGKKPRGTICQPEGRPQTRR